MEKIFQPSRNALWKWLFTNKKEMLSAGITRPGLFSTYNLFTHLLGVVIIIFLEAAATFIAYDDGLLPLAVIVLLIVDFILAIISHIPSARIIELKNRVITISDSVEIENYYRKISKLNLIKNFFYFLIIISALTKIYIVYHAVYYNQFTPNTIFITVAYVVGAVLHITCTGNVLYALYFNIGYYSGKSKFISSNGLKYCAEDSIDHKIINPNSLKFIECSYGNHKISKKGDDYFISSFGILEDKDLTELINKQIEPEQKRKIAIEGVKSQLNLLQ